MSADTYVYPGTDVLINKFDCRDAEKLKEIEALSTGANLAYLQLHPVGAGRKEQSYLCLQLYAARASGLLCRRAERR